MIRKTQTILLLFSVLVLTDCGGVVDPGLGMGGPAPFSTANEGLFTSLAIDGSGQPHISFYDSTDAALKYTWYDSARQIWNDQFVDFGGPAGVGMDNSLALDPVTGFPRISYYDQTYRRLLMASWNGIQWVLEVADPGLGHDVGQFSSLVLDRSGHPSIAYYDATQGSLKLVASSLTTPPFNFPLPSTVDAENVNVGQYCSLTLDQATQEYRIAYYDALNRVNKVAAWDNTTLKFYAFPVDSLPGRGTFNSLAVDAAGIMHLAYYDPSNLVLKYAKSSLPPFTMPPVWSIEVADPGFGNNVGLYASLALDSAGNPSIAYYDATFFTLKVARRAGTGWNISFPVYFGASSPNAGLYDSIKINPLNGSVYVSYYDMTDGQLGFYSSF
ncbi:MAG: hypothetical protein ACYDBV_07170 [Nitrospiria bacterium]